MKPRVRAPDQALSPRRSTPLTRVQLQQLLEQKDKCVGDLYVCVCVWWGVVFFIIILLGEADKTHLIVLYYSVTKTGVGWGCCCNPSITSLTRKQGQRHRAALR